jgi:hypothetical protein
MEDGYISLREFERRFPVTLRAIQKAVESGRVTDVLRTPAGTLRGIHATNAWDEWLRNTDQGESAKSGKMYPVVASTTHASTPSIDSAPEASLLGDAGQGNALPSPASAVSPPAQSGNAGAGSTEPGFQDHRTKREKFLAEQAELEYLEKVGALVSVSEVDRANEEIWAALKTNAFRMIPKKAAILAAETDPARVERLLTDALTQVFNESSQSFADAPAGGVEERAPALP